jgi:hypothetical protein
LWGDTGGWWGNGVVGWVVNLEIQEKANVFKRENKETK